MTQGMWIKMRKWMLAVASMMLAVSAIAEELDLSESNALPGIRDIFLEICKVPRYSSHEVHMGDWLMAWAKEHHLTATRDRAGGNGNVIIEVPATMGMEGRELVVFQTHQDMVRAVKEGVTHDWDKDPVVPVVEDGWLHSKGRETSLGADDGIGIATALAIAEGRVSHGPLRLIMTVEEETTQAGVKGLDPKTVADAKFLVNIDSETEGEVVISSACADMSAFTLAPECETPYGGGKALAVEVSGLLGGHSGHVINRKRANAIIELGTMLSNLVTKVGLQLASFTGGTADNALPVSATAVIVLESESDANTVNEVAAAIQTRIREGEDTNACVTVSALEQAPDKAFTVDVRDKLLALVTGLPNGVIKMSEFLTDLVQTSSNLGTIRTTASEIRIGAAMRSSSEEDYAVVLKAFGEKAEECGFSWRHTKNCEIWPVDLESELLEICEEAYKDAFDGKEINVVAVHAGLECGTFKVKNPKLDMISIGPTVLDPHSVNERCELASCEKVFTLLQGILARIPEAKEIILPAGSDQCQSEPTNLERNGPVGAVQLTDPPKDNEEPPPPGDGEFTYVVFGDTQNYHFPTNGGPYTNESFVVRVDWLLKNWGEQKCEFLSHLGDVADNPFDRRQWAIASNQFARLAAANIPFAFAAGNHDEVWGDTTPIAEHLPTGWVARATGAALGDKGTFVTYDGFDGLQYSKLPKIGKRFTDREGWDAPKGRTGVGGNSYQLLTLGEAEFIFIHLQCSIPTNVLQWADGLLTEYSDRLAIIVEHEGLGDVNGTLPYESEADRLNIGRMRASRYTSNGSTSAQYQWERCFSRHPNVLMILSGHEIEALSHIRTSRGLYGNDVVEVVQNYPERPDSDWIRLYRFDTANSRITVYTYSPTRKKFCTGREDEFVTKNPFVHNETYLYASNCPHHFTINYKELRKNIVSEPAGPFFRTVTDVPIEDGSMTNGRLIYERGLKFSGLVTYPIVSRIEMEKKGTDIAIRYFLVNDYTLSGRGGALTVLGVVRPRVLFTQGGVTAEVTDALMGDVVAGGGGWYEVHVPSATVAERLGVAEGQLTDVVATVATVPEGTPSIPWTAGEDVMAYLEEGTLFVEGTGAMSNFVSAADAPWAPAAAYIRHVEVAPTVTEIGDHAFDGISANVPIALTEEQVPRFAGAISGAEFEKVDIVDGKAYLDVSVYTSETLTNQNWSVATNGVIEVPAEGKSGFFYLMSKPSAPLNK